MGGVLVRVERDKLVFIDYVVRDGDGRVIESSAQRGAPMSYLHGHAQIVPRVEAALDGLGEGDECQVEVPPDEAFGERDATAIFLLPREAFPAGVQVEEGAIFAADGPAGTPVLFRAVRCEADWVLVDANHPLAGHTLAVEVRVREVREPTAGEYASGELTLS